jgi:hypothetical protein
MYTIDSEGLVNNYSVEPTIYYSEYPSPEQQVRYALQGGYALLFITLLLFTAFAVS